MSGLGPSRDTHGVLELIATYPVLLGDKHFSTGSGSSRDMLSWSAEDQLAYLDGIGVPGLGDELALLFDDSMATVPALTEDGLLSARRTGR